MNEYTKQNLIWAAAISIIICTALISLTISAYAPPQPISTSEQQRRLIEACADGMMTSYLDCTKIVLGNTK